jgi:hypothetical protein
LLLPKDIIKVSSLLLRGSANPAYLDVRLEVGRAVCETHLSVLGLGAGEVERMGFVEGLRLGDLRLLSH